jgi:peptidyl-prolyl cis-trans isomerase D
LDHYTFSNEKVKISFVEFSPESFKEVVKIDDTLMEEYFSDHKEEYRIPDKVKISYITIDPERYGDNVVITDELIEEYYEYNIETFKQEKQLSARHILFKLRKDATEDEEKEVKEKASLVLEKARKGEDFSTLAKAYSEGPSGKKGGDLGYFSKGRMEKTFEEAAFKMKKGQISELVRTLFGYHIIKLEDIKEARTKGLEEVREQISDVLIDNESMDLAREKALSLIDQMPYDVDLVQYAEQHNVPVGHSGFFSQDEPIPDIGGDQKLRKSIFSLQKNDVSEVIELKNKLYVIQVVDKKTSYLPEMNEVSAQLKKDFTAHLATLKAKSAAEQYLEKLHGGAAWDELAKESDLESETTDFFARARRGLIPKIGYAPDLLEAIFSLGEDKRYPDKAFSNNKGAFVVRWEGEKGIDEKQYPEEKEKFRNSLMMAKQRIIFAGWLDNLKKEADIDRTPFERYK